MGNFHSGEHVNNKKPTYNCDYGSENVDMSELQFNHAKIKLLEQLDENQNDRRVIEMNTRAQRHSLEWGEIRSVMLTSSYFGRVLSLPRNNYPKIVKEILYNNLWYGNTAELNHQIIYETAALRIFNQLYSFKAITHCGLFIDEKVSFLGATPFRLYGDNGIVIVKCPKKGFGKSVKDALKTIPFWSGNATDRRINKKSHWFFEIQGQLHITKTQTAYLVIYLGDGDEMYEVVEIEKDEEFWKNEMEKELTYFYNEALVKELVDPRAARGMELRKYNSKKGTFE